MERKVTQLESCHVQVDVVVPSEVWKQAQEKATKKLCAEVQIDGFRKGKAPEAVARKHINVEKMFDEAINSVLPAAYKDVLDNEKIEPYAQPKVDITKISDTDLEVRFVIVTAPKVELGQYKDLEIGKKTVKVSPKEIDEAIEALRLQGASLVVKDEPAAMGDTVVMDFVGSVNGEKFEGGSAQNYELELGSHSFIPGFEEQLVGVKAGEHKDVNVTFPDAYTPELAGKAAVFGCDVHEVKAKKLPELTAEFIKDLKIEGVETLEALKENKKNEIKARKEAEGKKEYIGKLYEAIAKGSKIEIPEEMVEEQAMNMQKDMENRMSQSGLTLDTYLQYIGQSKEDFVNKLKEDARRDIKNYFILEEVCAKEAFELSDDQVEEEMKKLAKEYNMKLEDVKKALSAQFDQFKHNLRMTKIEEKLVEMNK